MAVLGDNPMYLLNILDRSFHSMLGDTPGSEWVAVAFFLGIIAFAVLYFRLDRGAIALITILAMAVMLQIGILPAVVWYILMLVIAAVVAYGILTISKQSDG